MGRRCSVEGALHTMVSLPATGQVLRIRPVREADPFYRSRLVDTRPDGLQIEPPLHTDGTPFAAVGPFWLEYHANDGALCMFSTQIVSVLDHPATWVVSRPKPQEIIRQQRREFVRVAADLPVRLEIGQRRQALNLRSKDISGGGIGVWIPKGTPVHPGDVLGCKFTLPKEGFPVDVECLVVRVGEPNEEGVCVCSLQFQEMREAVRQKIIQFTFWRQRYLLEMFGRDVEIP